MRTGNWAIVEVTGAILAHNALHSQAHVSRALQCFPRRLSVDIVSANLFQQEYLLESTAAFHPALVSTALWMFRCHHMQILSFKTFCRQISQRVPLNRGWTLYLFSHITKYISGGVESHTFKESQMECLLLLERWFLCFWYLVVQQEMERNEWWPGEPCRQVWTDGEWEKVELSTGVILHLHFNPKWQPHGLKPKWKDKNWTCFCS